MAGAKIQDADVKGTADVTSDTRLVNSNKIYITSLSKRLDQAITAGDLSGSTSIGSTIGSGTAGSILYVTTASALAQDNGNLFYDTTNKQVRVGTLTDYSSFGEKYQTAVSANLGGFMASSWSNGSSGHGPALSLRRSRSSTIGTHSAVTSGDNTGFIKFDGSDGTVFGQTAQIRAEAQANASSGSTPGNLFFSTTAGGSATVTDRMVIRSNGQTFIGSTTDVSTSTPLFQVSKANNAGLIGFNVWTTTASNAPDIEIAKSASSTIGTHTLVSSGDTLGTLTFSGSDGSSFKTAAQIMASVDATPGSNDMPGALSLMTTLDGTTTLVERIKIKNNGQVLVGNSTDVSGGGNTPRLQVSKSAGAGSVALNNWTTTAAQAPDIELAKSASATVGTHTVVSSGDTLGSITFYGSDGTAFRTAAQIKVQVDATPGSNDMPGRMQFFTTADGSTTLTERARFSNTGAFTVGDQNQPAGPHTFDNSSTANNTFEIRNRSTSTSADSIYALRITKGSTTSTSAQSFVLFDVNAGGAHSGKITANGVDAAAFNSTSDIRIKENVVTLPSQLKYIMALRPVEFDYKNLPEQGFFGGHQIGFVAQEMMEIYPESVNRDEKSGYFGITGWDKTSARLVSAMQEMYKEVIELREKVNKLENG